VTSSRRRVDLEFLGLAFSSRLRKGERKSARHVADRLDDRCCCSGRALHEDRSALPRASKPARSTRASAGARGGALVGSVAALGLPAARRAAVDEALEGAVRFLVATLGRRGGKKPKRGKKPVIVHSLGAAFWLRDAGYGPDVVVAGLLHDVIERADLSPARLGRKFGPEVAALVAAATNDARLEGPLDRWADSLERCARLGEAGLAVRAADLVDNAHRVTAVGPEGDAARVAAKASMLVAVCRAAGVDAPWVATVAQLARMLAARPAPLASAMPRHAAVAAARRRR
jgi:hypothetical protein